MIKLSKYLMSLPTFDFAYASLIFSLFFKYSAYFANIRRIMNVALFDTLYSTANGSYYTLNGRTLKVYSMINCYLFVDQIRTVWTNAPYLSEGKAIKYTLHPFGFNEDDIKHT